MPIIFDEITAEVAPPAPTTSSSESRGEGRQNARVDPQSILREIQRIAERAERLNAE